MAGPERREPGKERTRSRLLWVNHFAVGPEDEGGTRHFEMARELAELGWTPTIAASDYTLQRRDYSRRETARAREPVRETIGGVTFQWLWAAPYRRNDWRRGWNWLSFARSLGALSRSERYDVVIGSSPHLLAAMAAHRLARRQDVPFVFEVRDLWPESLLAAGGSRGPFYYALKVMAGFLYRRADRIVVLARGSREHLVRSGVPAAKIAFVPNGVDPSAFSQARTESGDGVLRCVYAGAHGPANGLDTVLRAAALLRDRKIRFLLVGDGPAKEGLRELAREMRLDNVEFREPVPKACVPELLGGADVGMMVLRDSPLFSYGVSPNKLFDYLAAGLPVVTNVPGEVAHMVAEAGAGEVVDPGSPRALAEGLSRMAERDAEERARMGRSGRAWVSREHGRAGLARRLDGVLRGVMEEG